MSEQAKIANLEEQRKIKLEQYLRANRQLSTTLNDSDKPILEKQILKLDQEMEEFDIQIAKLKQSSNGENSYREASRCWEDKLPQINFSKSKSVIARVLDRFETQGEGEAIFLLQRSSTMKGDLCIQHIKSSLQKMGEWRPPFEYSFQYDPFDRKTFVNALADKFSTQSTTESSPSHTQEVINKICESLVGGNVLFFQIEVPCVDNQDGCLEWFVNNFWNELITKIEQRRSNHPFIKVVGVIAIRDIVPKNTLAGSMFCTQRDFDGRKILDLPLEKWSQPEINKWLWKYSGLSRSGYEKNRIENIATRIYNLTRGEPDRVYSQLMDFLKSV
jgi:hypothetical protein